MSGRIVIDLFSTLDGVVQGPGGPEEDVEGGFAYGGWQAPLLDDAVGEQVMAGMSEMDALLLGRKTYDIFAGYWPTQDERDTDVARTFNRIPKYVVSRGAPRLDWEGSTLVGPDLTAEVAALRERHASVHVVGSAELARTLVARRLFDVLNLWVYPVVLGPGKRLFPDDGPSLGLRLLQPPVSGGVAVLLRYGPGEEVRTGDMTTDDRP
ncbi:dihydrofolate reductase family protein [Pseudokineococcus basanitobsidens]|uniref:Dihydrofolate reductase family protein n=1 Tax=Pseudokineococcus basanitobsidens TaxID=1926649 RepID=A0ABU8RKE9_9ACTN